MNNTFTPAELKRYLHYTVKENLVKSVKPEYFRDYRDIQTVYTIIKSYYEQYNSIPSNELIFSELTKNSSGISMKTLTLMMATDEVVPEDFIKNSYRKWLGLQRQSEEIMRMIDENHQCKITSAIMNEVDAILKGDKNEPDDEEPLKNTPIIPDEVFQKLPRLLKEMSANFNDVRERDSFLLAELVSLSAVFPTVSGIYFKHKLFPNLYGFVAAAAAGGKSTVIFALKSLNDYTKRMREDYKNEIATYDKKGKDYSIPIEKFLQIGGNASSAGFISELENNKDLGGLIFETEADVLSDNSKQDWGDYTTYLRKCFQHEKIIVVRKDFRNIIESPKLSVLITGTLAQLVRLIPNTENGLFSRFLYYTYKKETKWLDPSEGSDVEVNFSKYAYDIDDVISFFEGNPITFNLTKEQWERFNAFFTERLSMLKVYNDSDIEATLFRLGTNAFRIMMVLSILRTHEKQSIFTQTVETIVCDDNDFNSTLQIVDVFLRHAELISNNLSKQNNIVIRKNKREELVDSMPAIFNRGDIIAKGKELKISIPTIDRILKDLIVLKKIVKMDRFSYQKK
jgi:hypothetical protein